MTISNDDQVTQHTYQLTYDELKRLLTYTVHRGDCELIVYRTDSRSPCSCGLSNAIDPVRRQESDLPGNHRLAINHQVFSGRSVPAWLCQLVPAKYRPVSHKSPYAPSERSDG